MRKIIGILKHLRKIKILYFLLSNSPYKKIKNILFNILFFYFFHILLILIFFTKKLLKKHSKKRNILKNILKTQFKKEFFKKIVYKKKKKMFSWVLVERKSNIPHKMIRMTKEKRRFFDIFRAT